MEPLASPAVTPHPSTTRPSQAKSGPATRRQELEARVRSMSYLPTTVAVAMKFMELGKNPEAEPSEYAQVIRSDSSLSTKLLALANSSWFGVRNRVTKVQAAVNLLGLSTVRTLAISFCVTGLHNELRLTPEESRRFWMASLCKAEAARQYALLVDPRQAEEAFAAGLFQDFALPVMYSVAREDYLTILQDRSLSYAQLLAAERDMFELDHADLARNIALRLQLPELYVDLVAFHHNLGNLRELVPQPVLADADYLAGLFPNILECWNRQDAEEMKQFIAETLGDKVCPEAFLSTVQTQFNQLFSFFEGGNTPKTDLQTLLIEATKEAADNTAMMVGNVHELMQQAAVAGVQFQQVVQDQARAEKAANNDPLTGVLNRDGFADQANEQRTRAMRYSMPVAVVFFDLDQFKRLNDSCGHDVGDTALRLLTAAIRELAPQDHTLGRLGGDEFALFLPDITATNAETLVRHILGKVGEIRIPGQPSKVRLSLSAGMVWTKAHAATPSLDELLRQADQLMYQAKRGGGNRFIWRAV